jgi:hypothetical protein
MNKTFNKLFDDSSSIKFNTEWCSSNRSLNNAVVGDVAPKLKAGQIVNTKDNHGRKVLIIGTNGEDNVVLYQRFVNSPNGAICSNETFEFSELVGITTGVDISINISEDQVIAICDTISHFLDESIPIYQGVKGFLKARSIA